MLLTQGSQPLCPEPALSPPARHSLPWGPSHPSGTEGHFWPCLAPSPGWALVQGRDRGSRLGSVRVSSSPFLLLKDVVPVHAVDLGTSLSAQL